MGHDSAPPPSASELGLLREEYEIVGELRGSKYTRDFLATRRRDGRDVIVTACRPSADTNAELSHFAADAKLLAGARHPNVLPVLDVRWLDGDTLVVVREPADGSSLADLLDRGERMSNSRIAAALREVNSALQWAREKGVVHRGITIDNLFFETGTLRALVAFTPSPLPITGVPDESADAQTIGALAWTMLAGREWNPRRQTSLGAIDPNLAGRVVDAVDHLLDPKRDEPADVSSALGIIATGDVLKQAEVEIAAMKEEYQEQHRAELAKCEAHRLEIEQQAAEAATTLAEERAAWQREVERKEHELQEARMAFDRLMAERKEQLAAVRTELEMQAAELERRLAEFDARRAEFERETFERQRVDAEAAAASSLPAVVGSERGKRNREKKKANGEAYNKESNNANNQANNQEARAERASQISKSPEKDTVASRLQKVFASLDAPPRSKRDEAKRRWWIPAGIGVFAVGAAVAAVFALRVDQNGQAGPTFRIGDREITVTTPSIVTRLPRGGFLRQEAGQVAPGTFGPRPAVRPDTAPVTTPTVDTAIQEPQTAEPPRASRSDRANDGERSAPRTVDEVPPPSRVRPRPEQRERETPREMSAPTEPIVPRDSVSAVDTTSRAPITREPTESRRDSASPTSVFVRPGRVIRVDTVYKRGTPVRVNPDTMRIPPR